MTTGLSLVRHGETDWNKQHRIQGLTDIPLNDTGREQARATAQRLTRRRWDRIFSSPLSRARETATIIATGLGLPDPAIVQALVERDYGDTEGLDFAEVERRYPDRAAVPGQESREEVTARVVPALLELASAHPGESILLVSHGGAIRAVLSAVDPDSTHGAIANGSVHSFRHDDGRLRLVAFDDPVESDGIDDQNAVEARDDGVV